MYFIGFSGSLRKASFNTALLRAATKLVAQGDTLEVIDFSHVPLHNQDSEAAFPADITALKDKIRAADGIVISTPEFNRSMPGVLKNMLDWTSRPYGDNAWDGKPVLVMGATQGVIGTALAQNHLKSVLLYLNARLLGQPELYVGSIHERLSEAGELTDEKTKEMLVGALKTFSEFAAKLK